MDPTFDLFLRLIPRLEEGSLSNNRLRFANHSTAINSFNRFHAYLEAMQDPLLELFISNLNEQPEITSLAHAHLQAHAVAYLILIVTSPDEVSMGKHIQYYFLSSEEMNEDAAKTIALSQMWIKQYTRAIRDEIFMSLRDETAVHRAQMQITTFFNNLQRAVVDEQAHRIGSAEEKLGRIRPGMNFLYKSRLHLISYFPNSREIFSLLQAGPFQYSSKQHLVQFNRTQEDKFITWGQWSDYIHYLPRTFKDSAVGPLNTLKRLLYETHVIPSPNIINLLPSTYIHPKINLFVPPNMTEKEVLLQQLICLNLANNWEMIWRKMGWNRQEEMQKRLHFYKKYELKDPSNIVTPIEWIKLLFFD